MFNGISVINNKKIEETYKMELKSVLKKLIRERGVTITHVSRSVKVPLQTIHGWLSGSEPKNLRQVKAVADYFEVDLDYLCFGIKPVEEKDPFAIYKTEIHAGIYEVVLRKRQ
jgi:hypothetical protein